MTTQDNNPQETEKSQNVETNSYEVENINAGLNQEVNNESELGHDERNLSQEQLMNQHFKNIELNSINEDQRAGSSQLRVWEDGKTVLKEVLYRKVGSSRLFDDEGNEHHVTILRREEAVVVGLRTPSKHGYASVQVGIEPTDMFRVNKPQRGLFRKVGTGAFKRILEIKISSEIFPSNQSGISDIEQQVLGCQIPVPSWLTEGAFVDVTGRSKGRGFTGVLKRHNMSGPPATRGTHEARRNVGSIGCRKYPGKVFKGKRLPGHYGDERVTVLNLKILRVLDSGDILAVKGAVPGYNGSLIRIRPAIKKLAAKVA